MLVYELKLSVLALPPWAGLSLLTSFAVLLRCVPLGVDTPAAVCAFTASGEIDLSLFLALYSWAACINGCLSEASSAALAM